MEQRYKAESRTITKQYAPKIESFLSGLLLAATSITLIVVNIV